MHILTRRLATALLKNKQRGVNTTNLQQQATSANLTTQQEIAPYLDQTQQNLLLAALNTQHPRDQASSNQLKRNVNNNTSHNIQPLTADAMDTLSTEFTPDMLDFDDNFDFDNADLGGQMIGSLPDNDDEPEQHEKRKNLDDEDVETGDAKRQETGAEKGAKKPGRKPLTSEPTTKRKAQNRAAQRAFRERKEAHLKDLETKVSELTKSSEADKHENGLLRAQVDRLQVELREYRKRLSLNGSSVKRSPTLPATQSRNQMGFQFEFPKFGSLPAAQILAGNTITPPLSAHSPVSTNLNSQGQLSRHNSEGRSLSPTATNQLSQASSRMSSVDPAGLLPYSTSDNMHGFASTLPQMGKSNNDPFGDLFSPSILKSVNAGAGNSYFANDSTNSVSNGGDSTAGIPDNRVFRFNSTSVGSDSASPSMSSLSQGHTANSSCGTSPEPVNDSPATKLKTMESTNENAQFSFTDLPNQSLTNDINFANLDNFNVPQIDTFDPVLFGDYRDTNDNIVGGGDFTGGFFNDSFDGSTLDFGSPSNLFGILSPAAPQVSNATTPSRNLISECDKVRDGGDDDYGLPGTKKTTKPEQSNLVSCTKIWSQLQSNPDFQDGKFDLDGLCSELRTKARCSESGLMVDSNHVEAALKKMTQKEGKPGGGLMFEQDSWDNVLKKLKAGKQ
ncbi:hypothetical protein AMS68_007421 [Peltaster fructicola]|uniref:BZIP domain-containing protein n=1 Tax=Peltaster fructicola TaxID=286661 RepID=A0A6H0Y4G3_9PEZI|nr:hypothetical protein AMS68_007421 [Peltaster fructicola]